MRTLGQLLGALLLLGALSPAEATTAAADGGGAGLSERTTRALCHFYPNVVRAAGRDVLAPDETFAERARQLLRAAPRDWGENARLRELAQMLDGGAFQSAAPWAQRERCARVVRLAASFPRVRAALHAALRAVWAP